MKRFYTYLGIIAMTATPAAAVLFGWGLYNYLIGRGVPSFLAIPGGVAGAVAIESVGIYSGHVGMEYARRRDWRWLIAAAAMAFYVYVGWSKTPGYGSIFILAAFVYLLVALQAEAADDDQQQRQERKADVNWKRRMELERERMKHEERMARQATRSLAATSRQDTRQDTGNMPPDWRQLTDRQRHGLAHLPREQREAAMPQLADRTRRQWHARLDEIAAQNGAYLSE